MGNRVRARRNPKRRQPEVTLSHGPGERSSRTGKGKDKRASVSNTAQSHKKRGRAGKIMIDIPEGVTGTGEQGS
jgi:hypothetical protein